MKTTPKIKITLKIKMIGEAILKKVILQWWYMSLVIIKQGMRVICVLSVRYYLQSGLTDISVNGAQPYITFHWDPFNTSQGYHNTRQEDHKTGILQQRDIRTLVSMITRQR